MSIINIYFRDQLLIDQTKGVIFYCTPHFGSPYLADKKALLFFTGASSTVYQLKPQNSHLTELNDNYFKLNIPTLSIGEGQITELNKYLKILAVPKESSNPGVYILLYYSMVHLFICLNIIICNVVNQKIWKMKDIQYH